MKLTTIIHYFRPPPPPPAPPPTFANEFDLADATNDDHMMFMAYGARDIVGSHQALAGKPAREIIPTLPRKKRRTVVYQFLRWMMRLQGARDGYRITKPPREYKLPTRYKWDI